MKVIITNQVLRGNLNEGFLLSDYLDALTAEWESTVEAKYPGAEVSIEHDIQSACGATRELEVAVYNHNGEWIDDGSDLDLADWLNHDASKLADDERWYA